MIERKSVRVKYFAVLIALLRERQVFLEEIRQGVRLLLILSYFWRRKVTFL